MTELIALNPNIDHEKLKEGQIIRVPHTAHQGMNTGQKSVDRVHTVQAGETLVSIARQHYGVSNWSRIQSANSDLLPNPDHLRIGMRIKIPPSNSSGRGGNR